MYTNYGQFVTKPTFGNQTQFQPTKTQKNHLKTHLQKYIKG